MNEASIEDALKTIKENNKPKPFDLLAELEKKMRTLNEETEKRFSVSIAIPRLVPTEAWGDPDSVDRSEINRIFSVVQRGGKNIQARINELNKFLTPEFAKRKNSPNVILNMMMITEALQATLNDYNEASAGFVFEGFMAALTGGKQIAGRVRGTLPIEDFIAFSEVGGDDPVSLKLLGPNTPTHGSFTNLVDYLFYRGAEKIFYLIAYKLTVGERVEKLQIFNFEITRNNLVDVMLGSGNAGVMGGEANAAKLKLAIQNWNGKDGEDLREIARALADAPGYTKKGFLYKMGHEGTPGMVLPPEDDEIKKLTPAQKREEEEIQKLKLKAERIRKEKLGSYAKAMRYLPVKDRPKSEEEEKALKAKYKSETVFWNKKLKEVESELQHLLDAQAERESTEAAVAQGATQDNTITNINESCFHYREKEMLREEMLLMESGGDKKSQWSITRTQMDAMAGIIDMQIYGQLDLSQENIDELVTIYSEILGEELQNLLDGTKELTENIGRYYSESKRKRAMVANNKGQEKAGEIATILTQDPKYSKKTSEI